MSPLRQKGIAKKHSCPDSELLTAFSEDQVDGFVSGAIAAHLKQCPECAEVYRRLVNFEMLGASVQETEWRNAEKRLGNWTEAFLRNRASEIRPEAHVRQDVSIPSRRSGWKLSSWATRWALGAVAGLALVAATIYFVRLGSRSHRSELQVAMQTAPTKAASPASNGREVGSAPENSPAIGLAQPQEEKPVQSHAPAPNPRPHAAPGRVPSSRKDAPHQEFQEPTQYAQQTADAPTAPLQNSGTQNSVNTGATVEPSTSAPARAPAGNAATGSRRTTVHSPAVKAGGGRSMGFVTAARSAAQAAANLPVSIPLEYSTRLWIQLSSGSPPPDGDFQFSGTLLEPVNQAVGIPLDRDTVIDGFGVVSNRQISLVIKSFVLRGARYTLKRGSGAARVEPFDDGKTLEVWLDEDSVYEKPNGPTVVGSPGTTLTATPHGRSTATRPTRAQSPPHR
jgi:hypothetical protein